MNWKQSGKVGKGIWLSSNETLRMMVTLLAAQSTMKQMQEYK